MNREIAWLIATAVTLAQAASAAVEPATDGRLGIARRRDRAVVMSGRQDAVAEHQLGSAAARGEQFCFPLSSPHGSGKGPFSGHKKDLRTTRRSVVKQGTSRHEIVLISAFFLNVSRVRVSACPEE